MTKRHVFLVGPMGAGKTTIGKQLAQKLNKPFVDLDAEIVRRAGAEIAWIFDVEGESGFRDRESKILSEICINAQPMIVATGGGVVLRHENRKLLTSNGIVVYLLASVRQLAKRTQHDKKRPLLQVDDREQVLERLLYERDPLYREVADIVFATGSAPVSRTAQKLAAALDTLC